MDLSDVSLVTVRPKQEDYFWDLLEAIILWVPCRPSAWTS